MEVRSSRRMRTLVTQMPSRGLSANELARALISMMARSTLQRKAGYIDARPLTTGSTKSSCYARPDHTFGSFTSVPPIPACPVHLKSGHSANAAFMSTRPSHVNLKFAA